MSEKAFEMIEKKEFLFEEGVQRIIAKTNSLLLSKDCAMISISGRHGDNTNSGKTTLTGRLAQEFKIQGISAVSCSDISGIEMWCSKSNVKCLGNGQGTSKLVIILGAEGSLAIPRERQIEYRALKNRQLQNAGNLVGLPLSEIDMYVLIYRPDKLPLENERQFADLVIRNDQAVDKKKSSKS
jgi:hypothetical protein